MTMKSTRFFVIEREPAKKILKGYRKSIHFQMEHVQFFNQYKYSDTLLDVSFYNGNRILLEHDYDEFLKDYERTRQTNYLSMN